MVPVAVVVDSAVAVVVVNGLVLQLLHRPCLTTPGEVPEAEDQDILILPMSLVVLRCRDKVVQIPARHFPTLREQLQTTQIQHTVLSASGDSRAWAA
jgi:hypothetical protein